MIERIESLDIVHRELFTAVYGLNSASEVYMTPDLRMHNLWEALYLYLKGQGYLPVFYDDKAFSYEEEPLLRFFQFSVPEGAPVGRPTRRDFFKGKGLMSRSRTVEAPGTAGAVESHHASIQVERVANQCRFLVHQREGIFKNIFSYAQRFPQSRLAVVFVAPMTLTFEESQRQDIVNQWNRLHQDFVRNRLAIRLLVLYDFTSPNQFCQSFERASNELFFLEPFKSLVLRDVGEGAADRSGRTAFFLTGPGRDEIGYLLQRRRLFDPEGLPHLFGQVPWDHVVLRLWQEMAQSDHPQLSDFMGCALDERIRKMDTVRSFDRLQAMEGIEGIREQFMRYLQALKAYRQGIGGPRFRPHMALLGSPGTGKTTVARLFGDILREEGVLPKGHFLKVSTDDLVSQYVGGTRPKTRAVCERARGGVLFIDEAYGLLSGREGLANADYGKEAIEVLIQFMEDHDDSLVILAGYTEETLRLIDEGNQGFRRRFNDLGFFYFKDYSPEVLYSIALRMIRQPMTEAFRRALRGIIRMKWCFRNRKFGNVGEMENMVSLLVSRYLSLHTEEPLDVIHLPEELRRLVDESALSEESLAEWLRGIVGQEGFKELARGLFKRAVADRIKLRVLEDFVPVPPRLAFLFVGNPGTGKRMLARRLGELLLRLELLPVLPGELVTERSGADLLGLSPAGMRQLLEELVGKVLLIDRLEGLCERPQRLAEWLAMTDLPLFRQKLVLILSGTPGEVARLRAVAGGLEGRFQPVLFSDFSSVELYELLVRRVDELPYARMDRGDCEERALAYFDFLKSARTFGNAAGVEELLAQLLRNRDDRFVQAPPERQADRDFAERILPCDFPVCRFVNGE